MYIYACRLGGGTTVVLLLNTTVLLLFRAVLCYFIYRHGTDIPGIFIAVRVVLIGPW